MKKVRQAQLKNKKFFDKAVNFYEFYPIKKINLFLQRRLIKKFKIKNNSSILDAGCGTGTFLESLGGKNLDLYGIDISKKMVLTSRKRLGKRAKISLCSVEELEFKNKFDYIFSIDSFHHYADQEKAMKNFYRALKKEGKLVISDFSFGRFGNWLFKKIEPANSNMLLSREFKELLEKNNFWNVKQKREGIISILTVSEK